MQPVFRVTAPILAALMSLQLIACGGGDSSSSSSTSAGSSGGSTSSTGGAGSGTTSGGGGGTSSGGGTGTTGGSGGGGTSGSGSGGGGSGTSTSSTLTFPIEVLGVGLPSNPTVAEVGVGINASQLSSATQLWFQCHRCGFYAAPEFEATTQLPQTVKASVRVIGGGAPANDANVPWVDVTDANVQLADAERVQGGVNGAFYTTRITLPLTAAMRASLVALPSYNRIQFRFNGTDGTSNGFRILALQVLDQNGNNLIANDIAQADPMTDRSVAGFSQADVTAGQTLWNATATITKSSIVARKLQASCNSCHAQDARDLQYYNYSNNSIVQRSQFHGLTAAQGQQIVAFVRTIQAKLAYAANARPWNPPYQPGPGLDCTGPGCETNWAAGAGLGAVLQTPADVVSSLFGKPLGGPVTVSQADIDAVMNNPAADLNARQMQIGLQLPDWNAWLPAAHPADIWPQIGNSTNSFNTGAQWSAEPAAYDPNGAYHNLVAWFTANANPNGVYGDWSNLTPAQRATAQQMFYALGWEAYTFLGGGRGNHIATSGEFGAQIGAANMQQLANAATMAVNAPGSFTTNSFIERAMESVLHWNAVKQWEMAHTFGLEGNQQWWIGDYDATANTWTGRGEAHGWPFNTPGLFYLAPHMEYQADTNSSGQVTRQYYMSWQANDVIGSYYSTNQWYQLALIVNPGGRSGFTDYPLDWDYMTGFDELLSETLGPDTASQTQAQMHYAREIQNVIKMAQYVDNNLALNDPTQPNVTLNIGVYSRAEALRHQTPSLFMDRTLAGNDIVARSPWHFLDSLSPGLYLEVINGFIGEFNALYAGTQASAWRRCDPNNTQLGESELYVGFCLDATYTPLGQNSDGSFYEAMNSLGQTTNEQAMLWSVYEATQMGAEPQRLQTMTNWVNAAWPH
jgi:hypothetical protein